jgi:hypothetical protein
VSEPLPVPIASAFELARPAPPAVPASVHYSPVAAHQLSTLDDLVTGFLLCKRAARS